MGTKNRNLLIVRSVADQGMSVVQAAKKYKVSRQWVYTLLHRYRHQGPAGLEPLSRAPGSSPSRTLEKVRARIIQLRADLTRQGADNGAETIAWHLTQEGLNPPAPATIHRILSAEGMVKPQPHKRPRSSWIRFQADQPNECWQSDITHWSLADGTRVEILDFLDDHSRYLLTLTASPGFSGADVVQCMLGLIERYGPPASTLTDNGLVFTSRFASHPGAKNGFEILLAEHRIIQKNGKPGHPQTQGKIERFHQTLKRWLRARPLPTDIPQLQSKLDEFTTWYNTARPHRAINRKTPHTAYTTTPKAAPASQNAPEHRIRTDIVDRDGKVTLRYAGSLRHLGIGRAHSGTPVLMLINDRHVTTSNANTGQIIAEHHIDPNKDYQPQTPREPRPA